MRTVKKCEMWMHVTKTSEGYVPMCKTALEYEGDNVSNLHHLKGVAMRNEDNAWESVIRAATQAAKRLNCEPITHYMMDGVELPVH